MKSEFERYATGHLGISSLKLHDYQNSMTPYILEERELRATQMDIFSRLMMDRIIWIAGGISEMTGIIVQAQLMFLDNTDDKDITMHIDSPGGYVKAGLGIIDVMDYINAEIVTVNTGMAASMGSVLLAAGTKGKRSSLRFSKTMLHQSSGGAMGNIQDARISMNEWEKTNKILFELLGKYCGKTAKRVEKDASRDLWLDAEEALKYKIIDEVIKNKNK
jgi:ATP-dependent Clp protease protease subunit|tara:strand:- start:2568 stop:3224 length:657 start_codon:yes stop_codon:yes gene_type:complete